MGYRFIIEERKRMYNTETKETNEEWIAIHTGSSEDKATLGEMLKAIAGRLVVIVR